MLCNLCHTTLINLIIAFKGCLSSSEKDLKNSGLNRDSNSDVCNAGADQLGAGSSVKRL